MGSSLRKKAYLKAWNRYPGTTSVCHMSVFYLCSVVKLKVLREVGKIGKPGYQEGSILCGWEEIRTYTKGLLQETRMRKTVHDLYRLFGQYRHSFENEVC